MSASTRRLDLVHIALLAALAFLSVISSPRQVLLIVVESGAVPLDFSAVMLSVPDYILLALIVFSALRLILGPRYRARLIGTFNLIVDRLGGVWWGALAVWAALSSLWALEPALARASAAHYIALLFAALVLADLVQAGVGWGALYGLIASASLQAVIAILQTLNNNPVGLSALGEVSRFWYEPASYYRAPGLSMHPNYLAGYLMLALFAVALLAAVHWDRAGRAVSRQVLQGMVPFGALGGLFLIGIVCTTSRSALVGTAVGAVPILIGVLFSLRGRMRVLLLAGMGGTALVAIILLGVVLRGEFVTRLFAGREFFFDKSWEVIRDYPILGVGENNLMVEIARRYGEITADPLLPVHNVYLYLWGTLGVIGMALMVIACGSLIVRWRRAGTARFVWTAAFVAVCVVMLFDNYWWAVHPHRVLFVWAIGLWWGLAARDVPQ